MKHTHHRAYWREQQSRVGGTQGAWGFWRGGVWGVRDEGGGWSVGWGAGRLVGRLGLQAAGGAFQLWAELGSLGHGASCCPFRCRCPCWNSWRMKPWKSSPKPSGVSPPAPSSHETLGDFAGFESLAVGFRDVTALSDSLTTHKYCKSPTESRVGGQDKGDRWGNHGQRLGAGLVSVQPPSSWRLFEGDFSVRPGR